MTLAHLLVAQIWVEAPENIGPGSVAEAEVKRLSFQHSQLTSPNCARKMPDVDARLCRGLAQQMRPDVIRVGHGDEVVYLGGREEDQFRSKELVGRFALIGRPKLAQPIREALDETHARRELLILVILQTRQNLEYWSFPSDVLGRPIHYRR